MNHIIFLFASSLSIAILVSCSEDIKQNPILPEAKGTIKGIVTETKTNAPLYYVSIKTIPETKIVYTDQDGTFEIKDIKPGDYKVLTYLQGYDVDSAFVSIKDRDTAQVNMNLLHFGEYLDYYPLEIGNYWEYWSGNSPGFSAEVISDTMIAGKIYRIIKEESLVSQNIEFRYERVDEYSALVYRYFPSENQELLIDSMAAKVGQSFTSNMFFDPYTTCSSTCYSMEEKEIFGEIRTVRNLWHSCGQDLPWYKLAKGIGLYSYGWPRPPGGYTLKYAIINGVEYGERIVKAG